MFVNFEAGVVFNLLLLLLLLSLFFVGIKIYLKPLIRCSDGAA